MKRKPKPGWSKNRIRKGGVCYEIGQNKTLQEAKNLIEK